MLKTTTRSYGGLAALCLFSASVMAQAPGPTAEPDPAMQAYTAALEGAERLDGLLRLVRKKDQLLCELGPEHLDHPYLMFTTLKTGIGFGFLVSGVGIFDEWMVTFHRQGERIEFRRLNTRFLAPNDPQLGLVVEEGYSDSVAVALPLVGENKEAGTVLVDLSGLFFQDLPDLAGVLRFHLPIPYYLDPSRSAWGAVKVFPLNVELDVQHTMATDQYFDLGTVLDSRALPLTVRFSLVEPPDPGAYTPRFADDRVGYFLTALNDLSKPGDDDAFQRYITRWRIEKANPQSERSAPRQPLVIYMDKSIPYTFRPAVRQGLLEWNKAFEAIGIVDAIEVRFQPGDADWDSEDARYSTVRWSTDAGFVGISPIRFDPRSGQIIDTDILINAESLRGYAREWRLIPRQSDLGQDAALRALAGIRDPGPATRLSRGSRTCTLAEGLGAQVGLGLLSLETGGVAPQEFLDSIVRFAVAHELGHSLGLRHNFKGTTAIPTDKLHDAAYTREHGLSASIMDYPAVNLAPPGTVQGEYFPTSIGTYDFWAIEYGYKPFPEAQSSEDELPELAKIASRSAEPGLAFGTDEDLSLPSAADPYTSAWDLGSEPLDWARQQVEVVRANLGSPKAEALLQDGERFQLLRRVVFSLFGRFYQCVDIAARYVGGYNVRRVHKGQSGAVYLTPVPPELQRKALEFLADTGFQDEIMTLSPELLGSLAPETWSHWGMAPDGSTDFPLAQLVVLIRALVMERLLSPPVLARVQNAEMFAGEDADRISIADLLKTLSKAIWLEVGSGGAPAAGEVVSRFRRPTQRYHLEKLIGLSLGAQPGTPGDASSLAAVELGGLAESLREALRREDLGPLTRAHLQESLRLAEQALAAKAVVPLR